MSFADLRMSFAEVNASDNVFGSMSRTKVLDKLIE